MKREPHYWSVFHNPFNLSKRKETHPVWCLQGSATFLKERSAFPLGEIEQQTQMLREPTPAMCISQYRLSYINSEKLPRCEESQ